MMQFDRTRSVGKLADESLQVPDQDNFRRSWRDRHSMNLLMAIGVERLLLIQLFRRLPVVRGQRPRAL
jgi:hypothetical protein